MWSDLLGFWRAGSWGWYGSEMEVVSELDVKLAPAESPFHMQKIPSPFQDRGRAALQPPDAQGCVWPRGMQGDAVGRILLINPCCFKDGDWRIAA